MSIAKRSKWKGTSILNILEDKDKDKDLECEKTKVRPIHRFGIQELCKRYRRIPTTGGNR